MGGARNSARYRTLATCGAIITAWLANNVARYNKATSRIIIDIDEVMSLDPPTSGANSTKDPTDYDLVNACELWLADTATPDLRIPDKFRFNLQLLALKRKPPRRPRARKYARRSNPCSPSPMPLLNYPRRNSSRWPATPR